jgi:multicomponent K+:H+ antiporter subunit D
MITALEHLVVVPVVLPLAAGALMVTLGERRHRLKASISISAAVLLLVAAAALAAGADAPISHVTRLGNWTAPFGIVLVADRLSAVMVLLSAVLGLAALTFSLARWHRVGPHFHSMVHFLLAGLSGAFLTGDLFNLFVFFELLLAASYGLALYGSGGPRVRASLHYIVINLAASLLFLIGVSLLYGITGTLNMADLAVRLPTVASEDRALIEVGAAMLGMAFLVKAGMWPFGFWLPAVYSAACAPAAALFAMLSKVGVYAVMRVWFIVFNEGTGAQFLAYGGMATLAFGIIGMLASQDLSRLASFSLIVSSGTLLAAVGLGGQAMTAAAIYYLVASTLGIAALFLLIELMERSRAPGANLIAVTAEAFGIESGDAAVEPDEQVGVAIPATVAVLGFSFSCAALVVAGLPPLPGFVAKFTLLAALLAPDPVPGAAWGLLALLLLSGLAAVISMGRAGIRVFWGSQVRSVPRVRVIEIAPVVGLLGACILLVAVAGPAMRYLEDAAEALHSPGRYIEEVLSAP